MSEITPSLLRPIPPQPSVAWFLRDLVPDRLWREFDIGTACVEELASVQAELMQQGGRNAWLRFVEQTRVALPDLLSISLFEMLGFALGNPAGNVLPEYVTLHCRPVLSVYVSGRMLPHIVTLDCHARLTFKGAGERITSDYALASTVIALRYARQMLIERVPGEYFVPVPTFSKGRNRRARFNWFEGFGRPRF